MWEVFLRTVLNVFKVVVIALAVVPIVAWIRHPTRFPFYIHVLAFYAFVLGLVFAFGGAGWYFVILFPGIVYVFFIAHGGAWAPRVADDQQAAEQSVDADERFVEQEPERLGDDSRGRGAPSN